MTHPLGDTPPNGDFARYVDQLMREAERRVHHPAPPARPPVPAQAAARPAAAAASPATATAALKVPGAGAPFWLAARWVFGLWLVLKLAGRAYPPLAPWGTPLALLAPAGWWGLHRLRQRGGLAGLFGTPQWRALMKQYDAQNPPAARRGRRR
ncbi:hypothetical protein [Xylophilus sp.]|uniref:hypothetical protein n=1 Tax=Xylophilus sp. TaxID=2653893 RepID=UPI0013BD2EEC|nr:hypothetical protein [Xylophilus sp.]KAF1048086.1 MAG: hypothetical protein GAK38_01557 [Xylophilus sp.]